MNEEGAGGEEWEAGERKEEEEEEYDEKCEEEEERLRMLHWMFVMTGPPR